MNEELESAKELRNQIVQSLPPLLNGYHNEEFVQQVLTCMVIRPDHNVLELGGHIGRNSTLLGKLLGKGKGKMFVVEPDEDAYKTSVINMKNAGLSYSILNCAICAQPLECFKWLPSTPGIICPLQNVSVAWNTIKQKLALDLDVLVADCDNGLYHITKNEPEFLDEFRIVIVKNDYSRNTERDYVRDLFILKGYTCTLSIKHEDKLGFLEVWQKNTSSV